MRARPIPEQTVRRLFGYLRGLLCLANEGTEMVSSHKLAEVCQVTPSTIRKDFSYFGEFGKRGVGYDVNRLAQEIRSILKLDKVMKAALVGVGNIGKALLMYPGFRGQGLEIGMAFDSARDKIGQEIGGVTVEDVSGLEERIQAEGITLSIVAVPVADAPQVARRLAKAGVKAILSFAPCPLNMPDDVRVACVDLATEMARLVYYL